MLTHIIHYTAADCISSHGLCRASFRDAVSFRQRLPRRAHAPSSQCQNRQVLRENGTLILAGNACILPKTFVFQTKPSQFRVIARSAATWQSLSQRHGIPWRGTGAENDKIPRGRSEFHCKTIFTCPMGKFHMRSIFHLLKEQISLRSHARPKAEFHCTVRTVPYRVGRRERSPQIDFAATVWSFY